MLTPTSSPAAGSWLRAERERLRLSSRDVERLSYDLHYSETTSSTCFPLLGDRHRARKIQPSVLKLRNPQRDLPRQL
jgi:hypothetical protein